MREAPSSVHVWPGSVCTRVCVCACVCAHTQVHAGQSSSKALLRQDGCSGDGRRKGKALQGSEGSWSRQEGGCCWERQSQAPLLL